MKKIKIFSPHDISNAYSCLFYLKKTLEKNSDFYVEIWGKSKREKISKELQSNYHCLRPSRFGNVKYIGGAIARIIVFFSSIRADVIVINELEFFKITYLIKRLFKNKIVVHYNTELYGEGMPCKKRMLDFYTMHASFPDMIIECLSERGIYRAKKFNITKKIYIINNTVPQINNPVSNYDYYKRYINFDNGNPIVIYAGGCNMSRGLQAIIDIIDDFNDRLNFLLFCYGSEKDITLIKEKCDKKANCAVYNAVSREILFDVMKHCHIGLQYYNPKININNKLAAPSKFFEYMSLGLNIFSTNNIGIDRIIYDRKIGICFESDDQMTKALQSMLDAGLQNKEYIIRIFNEEYCYEKDSKEAIENLNKLIATV